MSRLLFTLIFLSSAGTMLRADDPEEKGAKPHDIKLFVPTPEPKTIPDDLRKPGVFDEEYPIPQDKVKAEKNRADWLAWWKKQTVAAWEANGKKDAPWAAKAKAALEAVAAYKASVNLKDSLVLDDTT